MSLAWKHGERHRCPASAWTTDMLASATAAEIEVMAKRWEEFPLGGILERISHTSSPTEKRHLAKLAIDEYQKIEQQQRAEKQ